MLLQQLLMRNNRNIQMEIYRQREFLGSKRSNTDNKQESKLKNSTIQLSMRLLPNNIFLKDVAQNYISKRDLSNRSTRNEIKSDFSEELKKNDSTFYNPRTTYSTFKSSRLTRIQFLNQKVKCSTSLSNKRPSLGRHLMPLQNSEKIFILPKEEGIHSKSKMFRNQGSPIDKRNKSRLSSRKSQTTVSQSHRNQTIYFIPSICNEISIKKVRRFPFSIEKMKFSQKPLKKNEYINSFNERRRAKIKQQKQDIYTPWKKQTIEKGDIAFSQIIQLNN